MRTRHLERWCWPYNVADACCSIWPRLWPLFGRWLVGLGWGSTAVWLVRRLSAVAAQVDGWKRRITTQNKRQTIHPWGRNWPCKTRGSGKIIFTHSPLLLQGRFRSPLLFKQASVTLCVDSLPSEEETVRYLSTIPSTFFWSAASRNTSNPVNFWFKARGRRKTSRRRPPSQRRRQRRSPRKRLRSHQWRNPNVRLKYFFMCSINFYWSIPRCRVFVWENKLLICFSSFVCT